MVIGALHSKEEADEEEIEKEQNKQIETQEREEKIKRTGQHLARPAQGQHPARAARSRQSRRCAGPAMETTGRDGCPKAGAAPGQPWRRREAALAPCSRLAMATTEIVQRREKRRQPKGRADEDKASAAVPDRAALPCLTAQSGATEARR